MIKPKKKERYVGILVASVGNYEWKKIKHIQNGSLFLINYDLLKPLKQENKDQQPHRTMCRQVFGKDANILIEKNHVVMCGFGLIDDKIYFDSEILNSDN